MPPTSVNIFEEGAEIHSFKIVNNGVYDHESLIHYMVDKPASYPGNSGCRNFRDVESDLKAVRTPFMLSEIFQPIPILSVSKLRRTIKESNSSMHVRAHPFTFISNFTNVSNLMFSHSRVRPEDGPRLHAPYPIQRRTLRAQLAQRGGEAFRKERP